MGCNGGSCSTCTECESDDCSLPPGMLSRYNPNQSTASGALVWVEFEYGSDGEPSVTDYSFDTLHAIASTNEGRTFAVVFGGTDLKGTYPEIFGTGVGTIYHVKGNVSASFDIGSMSKSIREVSERIVPAAIVLPASERGNMLGTSLATMMSVHFRADCSSVSMDGNVLNTVPSELQDSLISSRSKFPRIASFAPGSVRKINRTEGSGTVIYWLSR